jgi:pseudouridine-5'-phosphate glycosidase
VLSAGVKSIFDIPRTLEYLVDIIFFYPINHQKQFKHISLNKQETQGICVAAYKTNESPAFFTERSGWKVHPFSWLTFSFQAPSDFN